MPTLGEVHAHHLGGPQGALAYGGLAVGERPFADMPAARLLRAAAEHGVDGHGSLGRVFQLQVDGHVVGEFLVLQHLHGLVVLQHLHGGHVGGVDVVGGQSVAALQQVHLLHVEFLDGLAVILDAAVVGHLYAGHVLQHVADDAVALLLVGSHEVAERVAVLPYLLRPHGNLLQLHGLFLHAEIEPLRAVGHLFRVAANGQSGGADGHGVGLGGKLQPVVALGVGVGKNQDVARALRGHADVSLHVLALRVGHCALNDGLGGGRYGCEGEHGGDDQPMHPATTLGGT